MNILVVMAHPDDEVLGCGATIAKHVEGGDSVRLVLAVMRGIPNRGAWETLTGEATYIASLNCEDQSLDTVPFTRLTTGLASIRANWSDWQPDLIYTHWTGDLNQDHALTATAVLTAFRPKPDTHPVTILGCEILSSTEYSQYPFPANWHEPLTQTQVKKKTFAMACYPTENTPPRDAGGIIRQANQRGDEIGVEFAEAFHLYRRVGA